MWYIIILQFEISISYFKTFHLKIYFQEMDKSEKSSNITKLATLEEIHNESQRFEVELQNYGLKWWLLELLS